MNILERVKYNLTSHSNPEKDSYLLAVSGGKDSMVTLNILSSLKVNFIVAHVNYGLREENSDLDEKLVREICEKKGIPCFSKRVDTKSFCKENKVAIQEGARILRYSWFNELIEEHKLNWIVTAHHQEDNKETFIQNLKRGSGLRGLKSMVMRNSIRLKPILDCSRMDIDTYAEDNAIVYREDASNNQNHYQRNKVRNEFLPAIEKIMPGINQGISKSIANLYADFDYLQLKLEEDSKKYLVENQGEKWISEFKNLHPRLLFHLLEKFGFNKEQVQDVLKSNSAGKRLLSNTFTAVVNDKNLIITENQKEKPFQKILIKGPSSIDVRGAKIVVSESKAPKKFDNNRKIAFVDAAALKWPIILREYQEGDRIKPIGMKGSKKLSDYFTDIKMPTHHRANQLVVESDGEIIWIVGQLISDSVKLTAASKKVLKFETFD